MPVRESLPSVEGTANTVTLRDLIELVSTAQRLDLDPDATIVRGEAIAFRMADLGVTGGSVMRTLALAVRPDDLPAPTRAQRRKR